MEFDGHFEGDSFIHRIDPRCRVLLTLILSFTAALLSGLVSLSAALVASLLVIFAARLDLFKVVKNLAAFTGFIVLIWLILPLTIKGEAAFSISFLSFTKEGIHLALLITLKSLTIILLFNGFISTMNFAVLGAAMQSLKVPEKLVHLFLMTFRYVSVLQEEYKRLVTASKIRGFKAGANFHTYKTYGNIIGMLFVNANQRGTRVYNAMLCRGFKGKFHTLHEMRTEFKDYLFVFIFCCVTLCIMYLEFSGITF